MEFKMRDLVISVESADKKGSNAGLPGMLMDCTPCTSCTACTSCTGCTNCTVCTSATCVSTTSLNCPDETTTGLLRGPAESDLEVLRDLLKRKLN